MRNQVQAIVLMLMFVGCTCPRYTASFRNPQSQPEWSPIKPIEPDQLLASKNEAPVTIVTAEPEVRKTYIQMNKAERKELRSQIKQNIKKVAKTNYGAESTTAMQGWDDDLKLAAIFGVVGITGLILGNISGIFAIIGAIALIIGVVFFVKWIIRQ